LQNKTANWAKEIDYRMGASNKPLETERKRSGNYVAANGHFGIKPLIKQDYGAAIKHSSKWIKGLNNP